MDVNKKLKYINDDLKIFIIDNSTIISNKVAKYICNANDSLTIARRFTSDEQDALQHKNEQSYFLPHDVIVNAYKNNAFVIINYNKDNSYNGIALDEMYNNDIITLTVKEFNNIPNSIFKKNNILVIWIDNNHQQKYQHSNTETHLLEAKYLLDRLQKLCYMYFYNEPVEDISNTIIEYIDSCNKLDFDSLKILLHDNA